MKKWFLVSNLFLMLAVWVGDVFYILTSEFWVKTITSIGFVLIGVINMVYVLKNKSRDWKFAMFMLIGLFFAMLGDVVLELKSGFIPGAGLFAVGHVFYFVAYCFLQRFKWQDLLAGGIIFVPSVLFITLAPIFSFGNVVMEIVCVVYAIIISCMVGKSVANFVRERNLLNLLLMIGSVLFFISDLMLLLRMFADLPDIARILCLTTYYPAECLLANSLLWTRKRDDKFSAEKK